MSDNSTNKNSTILLVALILLLGASVFFIYKTVELSGENDKLFHQYTQKTTELSDMELKLQHAEDSLLSYKGLNAEMDSIIETKLTEIKSIKSKLGNANYSIKKLKNELAQFEAVQKATVAQLDSIMVVNKLLKEENIALHQNVKDYQERSTELTLENSYLNEQVKQASEKNDDHPIDELAQFVVDWIWNQIPTLTLFFHGSNITIGFKVGIIMLWIHFFIVIDETSFNEPSIVHTQFE